MEELHGRTNTHISTTLSATALHLNYLQPKQQFSCFQLCPKEVLSWASVSLFYKTLKATLFSVIFFSKSFECPLALVFQWSDLLMLSLSSNFTLLGVPIPNSLLFYPLFLCKFIHTLMILKLPSALFFLFPLLVCFAKLKSESTEILFKGDDSNTLWCIISSPFKVRGISSVLSPSYLYLHEVLRCLVWYHSHLFWNNKCYNRSLSVKLYSFSK